MPPTKDVLLREVRSERADLLELLSSLPESAWDKPTQLHRWRVRDAVAHLYGNCVGEFDEAFRRAGAGDVTPVIPGDLNAWNEAQVAKYRDWPPIRICEEYACASERVVSIIGAWQLDMEAPVRLAEAIQPRPFWLEARIFGMHIWVHGQDVRKATGQPGGVTDERMRPVIQSYFDMMPLVFQADRAHGLTLNAAFELSGPGGGRWIVEIENGSCQIHRGESPTDVIFRGTTWNYYRIGQGLVSPVRAIATLKLRPVGNPLKALRFASLFRTGKAAVDRPVEAASR